MSEWHLFINSNNVYPNFAFNLLFKASGERSTLVQRQGVRGDGGPLARVRDLDGTEATKVSIFQRLINLIIGHFYKVVQVEVHFCWIDLANDQKSVQPGCTIR